MINAERIAEMKRLSAEATGGPWVTGKPLHAHKSYITRGSRLGLNVANAYHYEDAQFIAESRQFVPDIITAYEEQAKLIRALTINLECIRATCIAAKDNYIEESDIDDILELVDGALK